MEYPAWGQAERERKRMNEIMLSWKRLYRKPAILSALGDFLGKHFK